MAQQNNPGTPLNIEKALQDNAVTLGNTSVPIVGSGDYQAVVNGQPQQLQKLTVQHNPFRVLPIPAGEPPHEETSCDGTYIP